MRNCPKGNQLVQIILRRRPIHKYIFELIPKQFISVFYVRVSFQNDGHDTMVDGGWIESIVC